MIVTHDTEDKLWWCLHGNDLEERFVRILRTRFDREAIINPDKMRDKYAPDLVVGGFLADLKTQNTPFFTADRYGLDPQFAVTFNRKDRDRYRDRYPRLHIYFWIEWQTLKLGRSSIRYFAGIFGIPFPRLEPILNAAPEHFYSRRAGESGTNAKSSFILDVRHCKTICSCAEDRDGQLVWSWGRSSGRS